MGRSFVLSELHPFLNVSQNPSQKSLWASRLEMRSQFACMQFWTRIEMRRWFVLSGLRPFLYVRLCRIEMRWRADFRRSKTGFFGDLSRSRWFVFCELRGVLYPEFGDLIW